MKIGKLSAVNQKGQVVIPQEYRKELGIDDSVTLNILIKGHGVFIEPVDKVLPKVSTEDTYAQVLEDTAGSWKAIPISDKEKKKRKLELDSSKRRKEKW